jgi:hypothetical protein
MKMPLDLPLPIADYFVADGQSDGEAVARCFTETATVTDEARVHRGRDAIRQWKADSSARYQYTSRPIACEREGSAFVVTSRTTGSFPGSPVDLRLSFTLDGDKIASLGITLP